MPTRYCLIPHPDNSQVLVTRTNDGWTLPVTEHYETRDINQQIDDELGLRVTALRYNLQVLIMENHSPEWQPDDNAKWIAQTDLDTLNLPSDQCQHLNNWFSDTPSSFTPPAWSHIGWYDTAIAWIRQHITTDEPIVQFHLRPTAHVIKAGDTYFKALTGIHAFEPAVTAYLAQHFPHLIPEVIAIDQDRQWMLQRDGGVSLRSLTKSTADLAIWEPMLRAFAQLQIEAVSHLDALIELGLEDRRLNRVPQLFDTLANDPNLLDDSHPEGIPADEREAIKNGGDEVRAFCDELASYNIPESIRHDDFHANNIMVNGDKYGVIDWGESYAGHPFGSLYMALRYAAYLCDVEDNDPAILQLRDVYLQKWTDYEPMARLIEVYELASRMQQLSRALTWDAALSSISPDLRAEDEGATEYWLRLFMGFNPD